MSRLFLLFLVPLLCFSGEFVLVSVYPFYDVVSGIARGRFTTEVLIPPTADYHMYELSSREVIKIARARMVFVSGVPLGGWENKVEELAGERVVKLSSEVELKRIGEHGEVRFDPHLWLSPKRMLRVAENALRGFVVKDPSGDEEYRKNFERVRRKLSELDLEYERGLRNCRFRVLPTPHPALSYLAEDYGLKQLSMGSGGIHGDLSPRELSEFIREIKSLGVDFIFGVYGSPSKLTGVLSREYGLKVYELNVKIIPTRYGRDYFSIMRHNLEVLRKALRCT
ncbi:metal ABC transporter substrate-binding protein [Hydrogenivirga sp.]